MGVCIMNDYNLDRFKLAQKRDYSTALKEIRNGHKESHWMWYIFPQLRQLGKSEYAVFYGIEDIDEARAYINDPTLGHNLREISSALLELPINDPFIVMNKPDDRKLLSSMTLFAHATQDNQVFLDVIDKYYSGQQDTRTLALLGL